MCSEKQNCFHLEGVYHQDIQEARKYIQDHAFTSDVLCQRTAYTGSEAANKLRSKNLSSTGGCEVGSKCSGQPVPRLGLFNQVKVQSG